MNTKRKIAAFQLSLSVVLISVHQTSPSVAQQNSNQRVITTDSRSEPQEGFSDQASPFSTVLSTVSSSLPPAGPTILNVDVRGDYGQSHETVEVQVNGTSLGSFFAEKGLECKSSYSRVSVPVPSHLIKEQINVTVIPSGTVQLFCEKNDIRISLSQETFPANAYYIPFAANVGFDNETELNAACGDSLTNFAGAMRGDLVVRVPDVDGTFDMDSNLFVSATMESEEGTWRLSSLTDIVDHFQFRVQYGVVTAYDIGLRTPLGGTLRIQEINALSILCEDCPRQASYVTSDCSANFSEKPATGAGFKVPAIRKPVFRRDTKPDSTLDGSDAKPTTSIFHKLPKSNGDVRVRVFFHGDYGSAFETANIKIANHSETIIETTAVPSRECAESNEQEYIDYILPASAIEDAQGDGTLIVTVTPSPDVDLRCQTGHKTTVELYYFAEDSCDAATTCGSRWISGTDSSYRAAGCSSMHTLTIEDSSLTHLSGLECLQSVYSLVVKDNKSLIDLRGLENTSIAGSFSQLTVINNAALTSLKGLSNVREVARVKVRDNPLLTNLRGLENLEVVSYSLELDSEAFTSVDGLNGLHTAQNIDMYSAPNVRTLAALGNLRSVGRLRVGSRELTNLNGLEGLTHDVGDISIEHAHGLMSLSGLRNVVQMGDLRVTETREVKNFTALTSLEEIQGINLRKNEGLENLHGFSKITALEHVNIVDNPNLLSLEGFHNVTRAKAVSIYDNDSLANLSGFRKLESIETDLNIGFQYFPTWDYHGNDALISLTGLESVDYIGGNLNILGNPIFERLNGLVPNQLEIGGNIRIEANTTLATCEANKFIDSLAVHDGEVSILGTDDTKECE